jgi:hypothetical protein
MEESMSPTRSRAIGMAVVAALSISSLGLSGPVLAAGSPADAVNEFLDMADSGDFSGLDDVVCAEDLQAMREAFDFSAQLGLDADDPVAAALTFDIKDRSVDVVSEDGDTATLTVSATMFMSVPDDQVDAIVRALLEADLGPDDPPVTDADVGMMAGFMGTALNQTQAINEEVTAIREEGEWLVCGGLIDEPEEPDYGFEPSVSSEGMCGITTPEELSTLGPLEYDSAGGFAEFCTYSTVDFDDYHTSSISLSSHQDAGELAGLFDADQELEVAGAQAYASGPDAFSDQLLVQVGDDALQIGVTIEYEADVDWLTQATLIAELVAPRIPEYREAIFGPEPEPTPEPTPEISLCEALPLDELNGLTGLGLDETQGDSQYCSYNQTDGEPGWHTVQFSLTELSLDEYRTFLPDAEDTTIADLRALTQEAQIIIELPEAPWTLLVSGWVDESDESATLNSAEMLRLVAETALPRITVPEPTE